MPEPAVSARLLRRRARTAPLWLPVRGSSMGWRYPPASRILIVGGSASPRHGEVWAFCDRDGEVVVHRFLARADDHFVFRGDAAPRADAPVPAEWLVGAVQAVDDGARQWRPRWWHDVLPMARAVWRRSARPLRHW